MQANPAPTMNQQPEQNDPLRRKASLGQTAREIATRFDFKGTGASIEWQGEHAIEISASADDRANAVLDVFKQKLVKRNVSLKVLDAGEPRQSGKEVKIDVALKEGISQEQAKKVADFLEENASKVPEWLGKSDTLKNLGKKLPGPLGGMFD